ncbi:MAG TPA: molybdopterin-dependent oxidoreductase [Methylomirabilota bacterium]|jgi:phenylacetyl-CoA:acceptor oxidoreductase
MTPTTGTRKVPTYCYQCVAGPDLLNVVVEDGVAVKVEPNFGVTEHPAGGRPCVRAYSLVQKLYNPNRVKTPMKRTNPRKGKDQDPGWVELSWDEALDTLAGKLRPIREGGFVDEHGYPRLAVTFGAGGTAPAYLGGFPAFLAAWGGPLDQGIGSGQGMKCVHSEHLYGEFWHRAFTVAPDMPLTTYVLSFGNNGDVSGGVIGVWRHAEARGRGARWIQFEPHMSITAATAARWVPIKPKTDPAVLFAILHGVLHEHDWRRVCDVDFLGRMTNAPYLVGPNGYYLREASSRKPLVWDAKRGAAVPFDTPDVEAYALDGEFTVAGVEQGPDDAVFTHAAAVARPSFGLLRDHVKPYTPEWAAHISDVPAETIREVTREYLEHARVGATIDVDGVTLPLRPVAILLGKSVNNGWGGFECCWARTLLAALVGALEVPGGILGTTIRLNRPSSNRLESVRPGPDGFMSQPLNATSKDKWQARPTSRSAHKTLVPLVSDGSWSGALSPAQLPWLFMNDAPPKWPEPTPPEVWIVGRSNPAISCWDSDLVMSKLKQFPFVCAFAYTQDETNWFADLVLPDATDLEAYQLFRVGATKYVESYWEHQGVALRQPVTEPPFDTRDLTDVGTELSRRLGILERYNDALNRGVALGVPLKAPGYDVSLEASKAHTSAEIWDRACRAATLSLSKGREEHDLEWFREHGVYLIPFSRINWYLHPEMTKKGLRYELPYQEQLKRIGAELKNRLHEQDMHFWDTQLEEYHALPPWKDFPEIWVDVARRHGKKPEDFPLWLLTSRSMQYSWGSQVSLPLLADVARHVRGHFGLMLNNKMAALHGIADGDEIWVESPIGRQQGVAMLRAGVRPDVVVAIGQFAHWATPVAEDLHMPNLNALEPIDLSLIDSTGSGSDLIRVKVYRANGRS